VTRYYRAPELLCEASSYGKSVDVWSIGCILCELIGRKPFFRGKSPLQQLRIIAEVLPCPPSDELEYVQHASSKQAIDESRDAENKKDLKDFFDGGIDPNCFDLLSKMLVMKPEERITVEDALKHPFLRRLNKRMTAPDCEATFENKSVEEAVSFKALKSIILDEMQILLSTDA